MEHYLMLFNGGRFSAKRWCAYRNSRGFETNEDVNARQIPDDLQASFGFSIDDLLTGIS